MEFLNSILIDGVLTDDPHLDYTPHGSARCIFFLKSTRTVKETTQEVMREECGLYQIQTTGRLAEVCADYLKTGRSVRVVGRLCSVAELVYIHAEHVEFKPQPKAKDATPRASGN